MLASVSVVVILSTLLLLEIERSKKRMAQLLCGEVYSPSKLKRKRRTTKRGGAACTLTACMISSSGDRNMLKNKDHSIVLGLGGPTTLSAESYTMAGGRYSVGALVNTLRLYIAGSKLACPNKSVPAT